jgi:hypothetical protein
MSFGNEWEQAPEPEPEGYARPRSGAVTAVGVVGLVLGILEIILCGGSVVVVVRPDAKEELVKEFSGKGFTEEQLRGLIDIIVPVMMVVAALGILLAVLRIVGGIGVLRRKRWGRTLTIVMASISILIALLQLLGLNPISLLIAALEITYIIMAFVILLNAQNAAEFHS